MKKILISSKAMVMYLRNAELGSLGDKSKEILFTCIKHKLSIDEAGGYVLCESKGDFEKSATVGQAKKMMRVLKMLDDQPITINFNHSSWLQIDSIIL